ALIANTMVTVFTENIREMQSDRYTVSKKNLEEQLLEIEEDLKEQNANLILTTNPLSIDHIQAKIDQKQQLYATLLLSYEQLRLAEAESISTVSQIEPAVPPIEPIKPKLLMNSILGALAGLVLTISGIITFETLDDSLKSPEEINRQFNLPVLGIITHHSLQGEGKPITESDPRSPVSEAFRTIRTNVQYTSVDKQIKTILVTSPIPDEGKTTVITNLATVFAQSGQRVTIIDGDMRRPSLHKKIGARNHIGLSSVFVRPGVVLEGILQPSRTKYLSLITAGRLPPNPSELLGSQKMLNILDRVQENSDLILIDTPPVLAVTDSTVLAPFVDGVILVVKPGSTKLAAVRQAIEQIRRVGGKIIGVILNDVKIKRTKYGFYYYKGYPIYGSYYETNQNGQKKQAKK
ncbi:MAG: polysaccharide biosynthesis tyrosine autokinase, partial [Anaerolineaceae bacterium]|nr:polysaccharide biosynthesis tyrosine autokinase [Anaerolineaceae bacterium]